jgi:hypothetical protein
MARAGSLRSEVADLYAQAMAMAEARGMRPLAAHCRLGLGRVSRRVGDGAGAQAHLAAATAMFREMDMRFWRERAEAETTASG